MGWSLAVIGVVMMFWGLITSDDEGNDKSRWLIIGGLVIMALTVVIMTVIE
jgi:hypothetical protein